MKQHASTTGSPYVLLLGNYQPDRQYSMRRFTTQLQAALAGQGLDVEIYCPPVLFGKLGASPAGVGKWIGYLDKYLLFPLLLRWKLRGIPTPHVVHICDHSNAIYTPFIQNTPHLVTCHDMLAVRSAMGEIPDNRVGRTGRWQQSMILKGLKKSRLIASVSQATLRDVRRLVGIAPRWGHLVSNALDRAFIEEAHSTSSNESTSSPEELLPRLPAGRKFIIHVGGNSWYKNRKGLLGIFAEIAAGNDALDLVIVGPPFDASTLSKTGCGGLEERIHCIRGISDDALRTLYRSAEILVFPSLVEGFGWPILEAQACGCPALTLRIEPMASLNAVPELAVDVAPDAPDFAAVMAQTCQRHLERSNSEKKRHSHAMKAFAAKFTNESSAEAYIRLYHAIT